MVITLLDVKEPTHCSKRVGQEVRGVVAILCAVISLEHGDPAAWRVSFKGLVNRCLSSVGDSKRKAKVYSRQLVESWTRVGSRWPA